MQVNDDRFSNYKLNFLNKNVKWTIQAIPQNLSVLSSWMSDRWTQSEHYLLRKITLIINASKIPMNQCYKRWRKQSTWKKMCPKRDLLLRIISIDLKRIFVCEGSTTFWLTEWSHSPEGFELHSRTSIT